jgi:hypothetical protein
MKGILIIASVTAAFAIAGGVASAGTPGSNGNGVTGRLTGNGAASYTDGVFGPVTCNETQHPKFDTVSCEVANPNPALAGTTFTNTWFSDFNGALGTISITVSGDGKHYTGKATY